jgi:hypothetical protein
MVNKVIQTQKELQNHLNEQLDFLKVSAELYDNGSINLAKQMASAIRVLLHDTKKSHSLLGLLQLKNQKFLSTATKVPNVAKNQQLVGSYIGLMGIFVGGGVTRYEPYLDELPSDITGSVDFDTYWSETIFIDGAKNNYSRKDIVLSVANQDGGSHVAPKLDQKYARLSRQNSLGWVADDGSGNWVSVDKAELCAVRQIAHELLRTLVSNYPVQKKLANKSNGIKFSGAIIIGYKPDEEVKK